MFSVTPLLRAIVSSVHVRAPANRPTLETAVTQRARSLRDLVLPSALPPSWADGLIVIAGGGKNRERGCVTVGNSGGRKRLSTGGSVTQSRTLWERPVGRR